MVVEERPTRVAFRAVVVGVARQHDALRVDANGADDAVARDALRSEAVGGERFQSRGQNLARIERVTVQQVTRMLTHETNPRLTYNSPIS